MHRHLLLVSTLSLAMASLGCNSGSVKPDDTGDGGTGDGGTDGGTGDGGTGDGGTGDGGTTWPSDCPALAVSESAIAFPATPFGATGSATVVLTNACTGEGDLDVTATISGDAAFSGGLPTTTLSPGATAVVEVLFAPSDYGEYSGLLQVTSNDADAPSVEVPLVGEVIADADGDGYDAVAAGGEDCDDADDSIHPKDEESAQDLVDDDCDGTTDEDWVEAGDVYLTEVMMNPVAVGDAYGEWFEVKNDSDSTLELKGWRILGDDGDELTIDDSLQVEAGQVVVFGLTSDTVLNGGVPVDVEYSREDLSLADTVDSLFVYMGSVVVSELSYSDGWPISAGSSLSLDPWYGPDDNLTTPDLWCVSTSEYGVGDQGTPGVENDVCTSVDHDEDGYSPDAGDCDDFDATLNPGQAEAWDGIDNNCDGDVDVAGPDDADNEISGNEDDALGGERGLSVGDLDADGIPDLVVGGASVGGSSTESPGTTAVLSGEGWGDWAGTWDELAMATVTGTGDYNYLSVVSGRQGDQDGDGVDDLVVVGSDTYSGAMYGYPVAGALIFGGDDFEGDYGEGDFDVTFFGTTSGYYSGIRTESSLDVDGDGYDDVVYANSQATVSRETYVGTVSIMSGADLESGSDHDFETDYSLRTWGDESYSQFGDALGGGDVDGDGYDELFITAPGYYYDTRTVGYVYMIAGGTSTLGGSGSVGLIASTRFEGAEPDDRLGAGAAPTLGDFDGDDEVDLALAAPDVNTVYLFTGAADWTGEVVASEADVTLSGNGPGQFGYSLFAGDFNGDEIDELVVGAPDTSYYSYAAYYADEPGAAYVFEGGSMSGALSSDDAAYTVESDSLDTLGYNVNGADFDDDGTLELILNAPSRDDASGRVFIFDL